jgi:hyperosmotically inducible periplasmic protein
MIGTLLKSLLVIVVVAAAAGSFFGYHWEDLVPSTVPPAARARTAASINTDKARQASANVGEALANSANRAKQVITAGTLTSRIKSNLALDDTINAAAISVATVGGMAILSGTVRSEADRTKAVHVARETVGVTSVSDRLVVR